MLGELFDPSADVLINQRIRPHWSQGGAIVFGTFRTRDSIPLDVLQRWDREKYDWLARRGLLTQGHWSDVLATLNEKHKRAFLRDFDRCREAFLDTSQGRCVLRRPDLARIVANSLLHFDGQRYRRAILL
jgi:type I restriction enzyme R subunit